MRFSEILRIVYSNIMKAKAKVFLTSMGIIVGAATIVLVIAIGRGGEAEILSQFSGLSAETIYVNPNYKIGLKGDREEIPSLTPEHMEQIFYESTTLSSIYIRGNEYTEVTINGQKQSMSVVGITEEYSNVSNLEVIYGEDIDNIDVEDSNSVAVIGDGIANQYFMKGEDAIGGKIKIGNRSYTIIGVLKRTGDGIQGITPDESIFIPFSTASEFVFKDNTIPQIVALAKDVSSIDMAMLEIEDTIDYILEDKSLYELSDTGSRIEAATKSAKTMNLLLVSLATIVFIVGGIGIMNVLFVSVKERTKEIGILKALGNSRKDIMLQFLLESVSISLVGGFVGVLLSDWILPIMKFIDIPVKSSISGKVIALIFSIVTGTVFGLYPAYKASQLKPIEALNYE